MTNNEHVTEELMFDEETHSFFKTISTYEAEGIHLKLIDTKEESLTLAETLQFLRLRTKLSQKEFAKKFFIPVQTYAQWEAGRRNPPEYVIFMIDHMIEEEQFKDPLTNSVMYNGKIDRILMELDCPVRFGDTDRIVMSKDVLGQEHYYLVAGECMKEDLEKLRHWLDETYDDEAEVKRHNEIEAKRNRLPFTPNDYFCALDRLTQLQDKFGVNIKEHRLNFIYTGR
jgi:putative transcriptional regulator